MNMVRKTNLSSAPHDDLVLRPARKSDYEFLLGLRKETMTTYLAEVGLPTDEDAHYERIAYRFENAHIVCIDEIPIGLLKYFQDEDGWHVVQIQIIPDLQGQGLGTRLLSKVMDEASRNSQPVSLGVLKSNPARNLYERLGFEIVGEDREEFFMKFLPA